VIIRAANLERGYSDWKKFVSVAKEWGFGLLWATDFCHAGRSEPSLIIAFAREADGKDGQRSFAEAQDDNLFQNISLVTPTRSS
jgi:hypothetical protein